MKYLVAEPPKLPANASRFMPSPNGAASRLGPELSARSLGDKFCGEADAAQKIQQSIEFMKQRLNRPLQVSALAASVNISQSHYFAIFKRLTGSTPIDYFIHLRMQLACHLLNTSSASVKGVAAALGYDDQFYFSRVFRSVHGVAPSEYRQMNGGMGIPAVDCHEPAGRLEAGAAGGYGFRVNGKSRINGEDSP